MMWKCTRIEAGVLEEQGIQVYACQLCIAVKSAGSARLSAWFRCLFTKWKYPPAKMCAGNNFFILWISCYKLISAMATMKPTCQCLKRNSLIFQRKKY